MRMSTRLVLLIIGWVSVSFSPVVSCAEEIRLYVWEDYIAEEVIDSFERATGHTVKQVYFDEEEERDSVISTGRGAGFDLILLDGLTLRLMAEQGQFENLQKITSAFAKNIDPQSLNACTDFGVPYAWGTMGIMYRSSVNAPPIRSWKQLFDPPEEYRGKIAMYLDAIDAPAAALLAAGAEPFSTRDSDLMKAYDLLKRQQPYLLARKLGIAYALEPDAADRMSMALGYSGDQYILQERTGQDDWVYVVPQEGTVLWNECWVAPKGRMIHSATKEFLAFINQPEVAAVNAEKIWFSTPNLAAIPLTGQEYQEDPTLYPPVEILKKSYPYKCMSGEGLRLRNRMMNTLR